ncbi:cytochrome c3 family protein [Desulfobacterota bacterium M19]
MLTIKATNKDDSKTAGLISAGAGGYRHRWKLSRLVFLLAGLFCLITLSGCFHFDPLVKHKILTTVFDGVPDLPSLDELCRDNLDSLFNKYYEQKIAEAAAGNWEENKTKKKETRSTHRPWREKNCLACHDFKADNKLRLPKNKICYLCHKNFIQGKYVHGPVAVGACLACHNPHSTGHLYLLRRSLKTICYKCHVEKRQAFQMHKKVISRGMYCVDCHDPHSGKRHYFLK